MDHSTKKHKLGGIGNRRVLGGSPTGLSIPGYSQTGGMKPSGPIRKFTTQSGGKRRGRGVELIASDYNDVIPTYRRKYPVNNALTTQKGGKHKPKRGKGFISMIQNKILSNPDVALKILNTVRSL